MLDLTRIDAFLERCAAAADDAELRRAFATFEAAYEPTGSAEPGSDAYHAQQMAIYEQLAGKRYSPGNEVTTFDAQAAVASPFPYSSGSCELVGNHLMSIGYLVRSLGLASGARVLDMGAGWGNTTLTLARMGYQVTVVDVEKRFCDLIAARAAREDVSVRVVNRDFSFIEAVEQPYDAVVFFESFHHAADHRRLIAAFDKAVKPGGLVCFGSEPITPDFPIPWGMRMDGESIWAIRQNGWFESGFNARYFEQAMRQAGWSLLWRRAHDCPSASVILARRVRELGRRYAAEQLSTEIANRAEAGVVAARGQRGFLLFGPYVELPPGRYRGLIITDPSGACAGTVEMDVCVEFGTRIVARQVLDLNAPCPPVLSIDFSLDLQCSAVEVRLFSHEGAHLRVTGLRIDPLEDVPPH